jgi:hypothetical protein
MIDSSTNFIGWERVLTLAFRFEAQILVCTTKKSTLLPGLKEVLAAIENQTVVRPLCAKFLKQMHSRFSTIAAFKARWFVLACPGSFVFQFFDFLHVWSRA